MIEVVYMQYIHSSDNEYITLIYQLYKSHIFLPRK